MDNHSRELPPARRPGRLPDLLPRHPRLGDPQRHRNGERRWITVGPADQPGTSIVLDPPGANPGITGDERRTIAEMMATYRMLLLAAKDLDGTFERLQARDAEVVQEPTEQPYGVRDCAVRDPACNPIRIQELR